MRRLSARVPARLWLAVFVQTVFLVAFAATDAYDAARSGEVLRVIATYVSVVALFGFVHLAFGARARAPYVIVFALFVFLSFAQLETTGTFDYGFAHENVRELLTPLGRRIATGHVRVLDTVLLLGLPIAIAIAVAQRTRHAGSPPARARAIGAMAFAVVFLVLPIAGASTHEPLSTFGTSAYRFHEAERAAEATLSSTPFPFVHDLAPSARALAIGGAAAPRPHVILLFLESWSGIYTDRTGVDGQPFTPVYNARRRDGLTFEHFYASSIQSSRGRFATMCSLIPLFRGKEPIELANDSLHCLPHVLADAGYRTMITSASDEPDFEDSTTFFGHLGFTDVRFENPQARGNDPAVWGVGLQDDAYYRKFFRQIDEQIAADPAAPVFAVGINASHHYPFDANPRQVPSASGTTKRARSYLGSLHAADAWLTTFFEELERRPALRDAIVVLVGDHSFPADEHGIHFNGLGAHEESFRTAFALRWPGHISPSVASDRAASQIDIAPTIADLLQLRGRSHFVGRSLVADGAVGPPAPMVQPYDGVRLAAVLYPFKLEVHERARQEHLYDLSRDPDEEHDLLGAPGLDPQTALLRQSIEGIRMSQAVLHAGRIWPSASATSALSEEGQ